MYDRLEKRVKRESARRYRAPVEEVQIKAPRPTRLLLSEARSSGDEALRYSSIVAQARDTNLDHYLSLVPRCALWDWQREILLFIEAREADTASVGCRGLLLCLDMGLGKTIIALSYLFADAQLCARQTGRRFSGATLILCQNQLLVDNWLNEARTKWPRGAFSYYRLRNTRSARVPAELLAASCDFVIAAYPTVLAAYKHLHGQEDEEAEEDGASDSEQRYRAQVLYGTHWKRVMADEGHLVVNRKIGLHHAVCALKAESRWKLTGTPIQNSGWHDAVSSCEFIGLDLALGSASLSDEDQTRVREALDLVMIRRLKSELAPVLTQPVHRKICLLEFESPLERLVYGLYAAFALNTAHLDPIPVNAAQLLALSDAAPLKKRRRADGSSVAATLQLMRELCIDMRLVPGLVVPGGMHFAHASAERRKEGLVALARRFEEGVTLDFGAPEEIEAPEGYLIERVGRPLPRLQRWQPVAPTPFFDLSQKEDAEAYGRLVTGEAAWDAKSEAMAVHLRAHTLRPERCSTKTRHVMAYIRSVPPGEKILIFSSFVKALTLLGGALEEAGVSYRAMTGKAAPGANETALRAFQEGGVRVMLVSLRYGSLGLNMVCANHMIFLDDWWNPTVTDQAENRIQRVGQTRPIHIVHFVMRGTIECHVQALSQDKRRLTSDIIGAERAGEKRKIQ
jgi:superfamily II DNA or RNA helicase